MRTDSNDRCMNILLSVKKMIAYVVNKNVKQSITPSARRIPKGLQRHESSEGWVKKLNNIVDQVLHNLYLVQCKFNSISVMAETLHDKGTTLSIPVNRTVVCKQRLEQRFRCFLLSQDLIQVKKN